MVMRTGLVDVVSGASRRDAEAFAARLEGSRSPVSSKVSPDVEALAVLARALVPAQVSPSTQFRSSLRDRLVTEAAARTRATPAVPAQRAGEPARAGAPRWRSAVAGLAVASVVAGAGAAAASSSALPGDTLYGLKLRIESAQLSLAGSDLERGRELLEQADTRLGEAERLAASSTAGEPGTRRDLAATLTEMERVTTAGADALTASYQDSGDEEPMLLLDRFVADQQERLRDLLGLVDPNLRARLMAHVAALGELGRGTAAVLTPSSVGSRLSAGVGDGWAAARLADRTTGRLVSAGTGSTDATGSPSGSGPWVDADVAAGTSVTDVVDDVVSAGGTDAAGSTPSTGNGSTGSGPDVGGAGGDIGAGTSSVGVPAPPAPPAPTVSVPVPLPSALPSAPPTLPDAPTPGASVPVEAPCVPVPPLSSC